MINLSLKDEYEKFLPSNIKHILADVSLVADNKGIKIYLIGGAVRDLLLGKELFDIDILVEGDAIAFAGYLSESLNCQIIQVQKNLRTAKIKFENGIVFDFASTRCEKYPVAANLPVVEKIACSLKEDVYRRDFTINSMAMSLYGDNKYNLIDYLGGFEDLKNKKLRVLHEKSFIDDPSRLIRGLKFAVRFGFELENTTLVLQSEYLNNLNSISFPKERIRSEIQQTFSLNEPTAYDDFVKQDLGKLIGAVYIKGLTGKKISEIINLFKLNPSDIWLVYLACLMFQANIDNVLSLNLPLNQQKIIFDAAELINNHVITKDNFLIYKAFLGKNLISLIVYYLLTKDCSVFLYLNDLKEIKILTTGEDLIKMGYTPSKKFGEILDLLLAEKLKGNLTDKNAEIAFVVKNFDI